MDLFFASAVEKEFVKSYVLTSTRMLCLSLLQMTAASGSSVVKMKLVCTWTPFIQGQCQLFVTGVEYCDFVVWTEKDIFIQSVTRDRVLGEIIGKGDTVLLNSQSCWIDGIAN